MKYVLSFLLVLAGVGASPALAQRHIKNYNSAALSYGESEKGKVVELSYGRYVTNRLVLRGAVLGERGNAATGYRVGQLSAHLAPQVLRFGEWFYLHGLAGVVGRYEWTELDRPAEEGDGKTPQRVTFGPELGAEADIFLHNRLSLIGSARKARLFNDSRLDTWPGTYTVGLRLHIH